MATYIDYDTALRIIYVTAAPVAGTTRLDIRRDIFSAAKLDWKTDGILHKLKFPFRSSGGDAIIPGEKYIGNYVFLQYGWRMRPYEDDHALYLENGYLLVDGGGDPWLVTLGGYTVNVRDSVPADAITLETGVSGLTSEESDALANIESDQAQIQTDIGTIDTNIAAITIDISNIATRQTTIEEELVRALGLMQENFAIDQQTYVDYQGQKLLVSARMRLYNDAASVGTDNNVAHTYAVAATWNGQEQLSYTVAKVAATTTTTTTSTTSTTTS